MRLASSFMNPSEGDKEWKGGRKKREGQEREMNDRRRREREKGKRERGREIGIWKQETDRHEYPYRQTSKNRQRFIDRQTDTYPKRQRKGNRQTFRYIDRDTHKDRHSNRQKENRQTKTHKHRQTGSRQILK